MSFFFFFAVGRFSPAFFDLSSDLEKCVGFSFLVTMSGSNPRELTNDLTLSFDELLGKAGVSPAWRAFFESKSITTRDRFANSWANLSSFEDLWEIGPDSGDLDPNLGILRQVFDATTALYGSQVANLAKATAEGVSQNVDEPIGLGDRTKLVANFKEAKGFSYPPEDSPSDSLLGRL